MVDLDPAGQAEQCATGIRVPVRRAQPGKGRDEVDAIAVLDLAGEVLGVQRVIDEFQFVSQPLDGGTAVEHRPFKGISDFAAWAAGDGGQHTVLRLHGFFSGIHQQEAAGAVGVLRLTGFDAHLAEQGRLLVSRNTRDRNAAFAVAVNL